jgi:hypothetical protein
MKIGSGHEHPASSLSRKLRDLVLFNVNPRPHRRISNSSLGEVDGKRLGELGPATDFNRVGSTEIYFYSF